MKYEDISQKNHVLISMALNYTPDLHLDFLDPDGLIREFQTNQELEAYLRFIIRHSSGQGHRD